MTTLTNAVFHRDSPEDLPGIFKALDYLGGLELAVSTMVKIRRLRRNLSTAFNDFEGVRNDLISKHGEPVEEGGTLIKPGTEAMAAYLDDYMELVNESFEVPDVITMEDLEGLRVKEKELRPLDALLVLEPEPAA